jgi:hypothetical protein
MFPGYLFAHFELAEMLRQVQYAPGVSGIVRFADRYPTIEEGALMQLRGHSGAGDVTEVSYDLSAGDQVHIVGGALVGLEAVVTQVLSPKERVKVLMHFLGRKMEAEVQCSSVLRQMTHPLAAWGFNGIRSWGPEIPGFWLLGPSPGSGDGIVDGILGREFYSKLRIQDAGAKRALRFAWFLVIGVSNLAAKDWKLFVKRLRKEAFPGNSEISQGRQLAAAGLWTVKTIIGGQSCAKDFL